MTPLSAWRDSPPESLQRGHSNRQYSWEARKTLFSLTAHFACFGLMVLITMSCYNDAPGLAVGSCPGKTSYAENITNQKCTGYTHSEHPSLAEYRSSLQNARCLSPWRSQGFLGAASYCKKGSYCVWLTQEMTKDRIQSSRSAQYSVLCCQKAEIFKIKSWLVRATGHLVFPKLPLQNETEGSGARHAHESKYPASLPELASHLQSA